MEFDINDPANIGRPIHFDLNIYIQAIIGMIRADEIQEAFRMLENPPAWYRKNYPPELAAIKHALYSGLYSQIEYATDHEELDMAGRVDEAIAQWNGPYCVPRASVINEAIDEANAAGTVPFLVDLGCSHGNLPLGLKARGSKFNYLGLAMNDRVVERLKENIGSPIWAYLPLPEQEVWLVCTETLEHAMDRQSLVIDAYKPAFHYSKMFWSVPFGCLYGGLENWDSRRLGHVRTYTEKEFIEFVSSNFPGFTWTMFFHHSMVLKGVRI